MCALEVAGFRDCRLKADVETWPLPNNTAKILRVVGTLGDGKHSCLSRAQNPILTMIGAERRNGKFSLVNRDNGAALNPAPQSPIIAGQWLSCLDCQCAIF